MKHESRFLSDKNEPDNDPNVPIPSGRQLLYSSTTGFFELFIAKHSGKKVVIKTLKSEFKSDPIAIAQLKKEFNTLFPLSSPNIAQALQLSENDNVPEIEMEWCDGTDVRTLLYKNLSATDAVEIIQGILSALAYIHQAGIVHRDIKPENVIYDPLRKVVKIIDFGCAYSTGATTLQGPNGTPGYTPSAKFAPDSHPEPSDDLYALGVLATELTNKINTTTLSDKKIKKSISKFADSLIANKFHTAQTASLHFHKLIYRQSKPTALIITVIIFIGLIIALLLILFRPSSPSSTSQTETTPPPTDTIRQTQTQMPKFTPQKPSTNNTKQQPSTASQQSESREELFNQAFYAGALLRKAAAADAPEPIKMDAFVINFCDSIYSADNLHEKFPRHMSEKEQRSEAKTYAQLYNKKMEEAFAKRFGVKSSKSRRATLLEGRFYATFQSYHYNPYLVSSNESN